jgi:mRNA-degrading endonuclease YafQ of YafQ-DinJ toxin-antitoxin module
MQQIAQSDTFKQNFRRRKNKRIEKLYRNRLRLFVKDPHHPSLNVHPLKHGLKGHWSFSLTDDEEADDYRVIFKKTRKGYRFVDFGTHDQLYRTGKRQGDDR